MSTPLFFVTPIAFDGFATKRPRTVSWKSTHLSMCSVTSKYHKSLTRKVEERLLDDEQAPPAPSPSKPRPLPMQRDVMEYHARQMTRWKNTRANAETLYRRMLEQDNADARAWVGLARVQAKTGRVDSARATFREGARLVRSPHLFQAWGVLEEKDGNTLRARNLLQEALKIDRMHTPSWVALGLWHQRQSDAREAARCFAAGSVADPQNIYVWHSWGVLERQRGNYNAARKYFRRGIEANPKNSATYVVWGSLEASQGNLDVAQRLFRKAHKLAPRNVYALVSHAAAAERGGQRQRARVLLERARVIRPNDPAPIQALALLELREGNAARAREVFEEATKVNPKHAPSYHAWACMEMDAGNLTRARELFQQAVWCAPNNPNVVRSWHSWGKLELEAGNVETARRYVSHGLRVKKDSPPLLAMLASIEAAAGGAGIDRAREYFEEAVAVSPRKKAIWSAYEAMENAAGDEKRASSIRMRANASVRIEDERLRVATAQAGDYASTGTWVGPDDLRGQDAATVRYTTEGPANTNKRRIRNVK